jgi:hypothetical protein
VRHDAQKLVAVGDRALCAIGGALLTLVEAT